MPRENLLSLFQDFTGYANDIAAVQRRGYRRESWTYKQLAAAAVQFACHLKLNGVRTGDRVVLWGPNSAEWMAAFWGCLLRGAVAVPMDDAATTDFAARVAQETSAKLVIAAGEKPSFRSAIATLKLEHLGDTSTSTSPSIRANELADEPITRNHVAQILFTSGTTAEPRGVVLTHGNFLANLEPLERGIAPYRNYERWMHPLRFVTLVPLSHVFGQFMALFVPPLLGATVVFESSPSPGDIKRTIKRERATALIAVPRMLDGLRNHLTNELAASGRQDWFARLFSAAEDRPFLRRAWMFRRIHREFGWKFWAFISGGAALSSETEEFFKRVGYAVVQGYGMTETASLISLNHPFRAAKGSVGKILPGREFRLADDGEILVRGENVARGYWQNGALQASNTTEQENDGWLRTGDLGEFDAEGNLRFRGRKKSVIVTSAGLNIYPEDLETALRKQSGVRDCVVIAQDQGNNAAALAILLWEANGGGASRAIESANHSLAEYQKIRSWMVWPDFDFPHTPTGKPKLREIAVRAHQLLQAPQDRAEVGLSKSADSVSGLLERFSARGGASREMEGDLNLTSLDRVELMSALEQRYQVELNETAFAQAHTVADVQRLLETPERGRSEYTYPRWTQWQPMRWLRLLVYYSLVWPATQLLAHPRIVGRENLHDLRGPILIISNHITRRADIGLILAALPARFRHRLAIAMGGEVLQRMRRPPREWIFLKRWAYQLGYGLVVALFNVFPLPQLSGFRESFRFAGESVDRGYSVLVFPEGEVNNSATGEMAAFQSGIGVLVENLRIPIVSMRLDGVWQMKQERRRIARLGEITVRIGAPESFPAGTPPEDVARTLQSRVRNL